MRLGVALYHPRDARVALRAYGGILPSLPNQVGWNGALLRHVAPLPFVPAELAGQRMLMLTAVWLGDHDDPAGLAEVERLTSVGEPAFRANVTLPFGAAVQRLIDEDFPSGRRYYTKEVHFASLPDAAIEKLVSFWEQTEMDGEVALTHLGGAIGDVAEDATAFAHREYPLWLNFAMRWDDPARDGDHIARTRAVIAELRPSSGTGLYYNMINFDEAGRLTEALGGEQEFARLAAIKARYDPGNLFSHNANIVPRPRTPAS